MKNFETFRDNHVECDLVGLWEQGIATNPMLAAGRSFLRVLDAKYENSQNLIVGGTVRDLILEKPIKDVDIATNIDISIIEKDFEAYDIGKSKDFGIVVVKFQGFDFEVAQFRSDGVYTNSRHPDSVKTVSDFKVDSSRRDFTINALGVDANGDIVDHHNGVNDIHDRILRTVGDPKQRFTEDAIRIFRLFRFASRLKFVISKDTLHAAKELVTSNHTDNLSMERVRDELFKAACDGKTLANFIEHLDNVDLLVKILPEIKALQGLPQSPIHHPEGCCLSHTLAAVRASRSTDPIINVAVLLHDVGKGITYKNRDGKHTYYGHENIGIKLLKDIEKRLKISGRDMDTIEFASKNHMKAHYIGAKLSKPKIISLVNDPNWNALKDVCYADEMSRGAPLADPEGFKTKMEYAESVTNEASQGGGAEGLKQRLKILIDGKKVLEWIPELNDHKTYIGDVLRNTRTWIINSNKYDATEEEVKQFAITIFNKLKGTL